MFYDVTMSQVYRYVSGMHDFVSKYITFIHSYVIICCLHVVFVAPEVLFSTCRCFTDHFLFSYPWRAKREQKPATTGLFDKP